MFNMIKAIRMAETIRIEVDSEKGKSLIIVKNGQWLIPEN